MEKTRIAVFVSGGGTNLQALLDAEKSEIIRSGEIVLVVSNNPTAYALTRAKNFDVKTAVVDKHDYSSQSEFEAALVAELKKNHIDMIVLAGFMCILSADFTSKFDHRIINVHPALIPSFCGKGYYGIHVHEAALKYGVKVTGATVHYVNEVPDGGQIIMQKAVAVKKNDTPQTLQLRVMKMAEWKILPRATQEIAFKIAKEKKL